MLLDSDLLEGAIQQAQKQFTKGQRNLLIVHPRMRLSIFPKFHRTPIERAFVSEQDITIPLDTATAGRPDRITWPLNRTGGF